MCGVMYSQCPEMRYGNVGTNYGAGRFALGASGKAGLEGGKAICLLCATE